MKMDRSGLAYLHDVLMTGLAFVAAEAADLGFAAALGFLVALAVRSGALVFGWSIPTYRSRPGRDPRDL